MYIPSPYFKDVPEFGDLELDHIFLENGYPVLFTCRNGKEIYLCVCRTVIGTQKWVVSKISFQTLEDMIMNRVSIRDAFVKDNNLSCIIKWNKKDKCEKYNIVKSNTLTDEDLPSKNVFLEDDELDDIG